MTKSELRQQLKQLSQQKEETTIIAAIPKGWSLSFYDIQSTPRFLELIRGIILNADSPKQFSFFTSPILGNAGRLKDDSKYLDKFIELVSELEEEISTIEFF